MIEQLPRSRDGYTAILNVVDRASKQLISIPTHNELTAQVLGELFLAHVFSKHGVPAHVTCDRGSEFVSAFFRSLGSLLGIRIHFTSGYNPQADGQSERANQTLEQYIRHYVNYQQDDWSMLLPLAEFAYNNAPNASTGMSPFFANKGYHPSLGIHPEVDVASLQAREWAVSLADLHDHLRQSLTDAQARYQPSADAHRMAPPPINPGDLVFVTSKYIKTTRPTRKFSEQFLGPFEVLDRIGTNSIRLRLPDSMRGIHPVFHVSQIETSTPNPFPDRYPAPPEHVEIEGDIEYEISGIVDSAYNHRFTKCQLQYKIKWLGYENTDEESSWLPATEVTHAQDSIDAFHAAYPAKPGPELIDPAWTSKRRR